MTLAVKRNSREYSSLFSNLAIKYHGKLMKRMALEKKKKKLFLEITWRFDLKLIDFD